MPCTKKKVQITYSQDLTTAWLFTSGLYWAISSFVEMVSKASSTLAHNACLLTLLLQIRAGGFRHLALSRTVGFRHVVRLGVNAAFTLVPWMNSS